MCGWDEGWDSCCLWRNWYLVRQLKEVAIPTNLPLFLHNRNVKNDLYDILTNIQNQYPTEALFNTTQESTSSATQWILVYILYPVRLLALFLEIKINSHSYPKNAFIIFSYPNSRGLMF
jgi:Tat protein secretion system quality control protein TatD with DNase activity